ncbi:hypothetical protein AHAS_Ahas11G0129800 [Arachis hypogaea]
MEKLMKNQEMANKNYEASMRNLERQIEQLSKQQLVERPSNTFPSDTIPKPKEECKAIQLRSGKTLEDDTKVARKEGTKDEENDQKDSKKNEEPKGKQVLEEQPQEQRKEVKPYVPPLPYPQRLHKEIKD